MLAGAGRPHRRRSTHSTPPADDDATAAVDEAAEESLAAYMTARGARLVGRMHASEAEGLASPRTPTMAARFLRR